MQFIVENVGAVVASRSYRGVYPGNNEVVLDMDTVFICPAQVQVFAIPDNDTNGTAMIVLVVLQHVGIRVFGGPAKCRTRL